MHDEQTLKWFDKMGLPRPSVEQHGLAWEDLKKNMEPMKALRWTLDGNRLIGHAEEADFISFIPTNYILISSQPDEQGLPQLKKLDI